MALRMELLGMNMTKGMKASAIMRKEIGLTPRHEKRMVFMYANNAMYAKQLISHDLWSSNIKYLRTRFND
jgi:hypothetical protein